MNKKEIKAELKHLYPGAVEGLLLLPYPEQKQLLEFAEASKSFGYLEDQGVGNEVGKGQQLYNKQLGRMARLLAKKNRVILSLERDVVQLQSIDLEA